MDQYRQSRPTSRRPAIRLRETEAAHQADHPPVPDGCTLHEDRGAVWRLSPATASVHPGLLRRGHPPHLHRTRPGVPSRTTRRSSPMPSPPRVLPGARDIGAPPDGHGGRSSGRRADPRDIGDRSRSGRAVPKGTIPSRTHGSGVSSPEARQTIAVGEAGSHHAFQSVHGARHRTAALAPTCDGGKTEPPGAGGSACSPGRRRHPTPPHRRSRKN